MNVEERGRTAAGGDDTGVGWYDVVRRGTTLDGSENWDC